MPQSNPIALTTFCPKAALLTAILADADGYLLGGVAADETDQGRSFARYAHAVCTTIISSLLDGDYSRSSQELVSI
jgi:hypothetical protein